MAAPRYRDLVRPTLFDTQFGDPGAGARAAAAENLANSFKSFGGLVSGVAGNIRAEEGKQEGAAVQGTPEFRKGFDAITPYGQAYNDAALRGYAIRSEADADDTAARLEAEAVTDVEGYTAKMSKVRDSVISEAPPEARAVLQEIYTKKITDGRVRIQRAAIEEFRKESQDLFVEGLSRATDKIGRLRAEDTVESHTEAELEQAKMDMLISAAERDGTITPVQANAANREAQRSIVKQTVVSRFRKELDNPYGDPIGFLEKFKKANAESEALPPEEEAKLNDMLLADLREKNALDSARAAQASAVEKDRYDTGDRIATSEFLAGKLTRPRLLEMVEAGVLQPSRATALQNELESQARAPSVKSDPKALFTAETQMFRMSDEEFQQDVVENSSLSYDDRSRLVLKRQEEAQTWKGSQIAKESEERIDRALGIVPGTNAKLLSEDELRQRDEALSEWYDRVDALPPEERQGQVKQIAEEIIQKKIKDQNTVRRNQAQNNLDAYIGRMGPREDLDDQQQKDYDATVERYRSQIQRLGNSQ